MNWDLLWRIALDMQDKHDMPLITADDTVEDIIEEKIYIFWTSSDNIVPVKPVKIKRKQVASFCFLKAAHLQCIF